MIDWFNSHAWHIAAIIAGFGIRWFAMQFLATATKASLRAGAGRAGQPGTGQAGGTATATKSKKWNKLRVIKTMTLALVVASGLALAYGTIRPPMGDQLGVRVRRDRRRDLRGAVRRRRMAGHRVRRAARPRPVRRHSRRRRVQRRVLDPDPRPDRLGRDRRPVHQRRGRHQPRLGDHHLRDHDLLRAPDPQAGPQRRRAQAALDVLRLHRVDLHRARAHRCVRVHRHRNRRLPRLRSPDHPAGRLRRHRHRLPHRRRRRLDPRLHPREMVPVGRHVRHPDPLRPPPGRLRDIQNRGQDTITVIFGAFS